MEYRGHIKKGVVVLDKRVKLKEGTEVTVRPVKSPKKTTKSSKTTKTKVKKKSESLLEALAPIVSKAKGLPSDFARNHDHYLHGQPKK